MILVVFDLPDNATLAGIVWIRWAAAPLLLVTIATTQLVLSQLGWLSRWRGGGYGMYSDFHPTQHGVWLAGGEAGPRPVESADSAQCDAPEAAQVCLRATTPGCLENLAACLPRTSGGRLELWAPRFDPLTGRLWRERIATSVLPE